MQRERKTLSVTVRNRRSAKKFQADIKVSGRMGLAEIAEQWAESSAMKPVLAKTMIGSLEEFILQALAEQARIVRLPLNQVGSLNKITKAFSKFEQENERRPSAEELADQLDLPVDKVVCSFSGNPHDIPFTLALEQKRPVGHAFF